MLIAQIVRFARRNIQIYDAHVVDLYQWICARYLIGMKGRNKGEAQLTQQSLRKPLDAGCFEGDSTRTGPKPLVQLYDRLISEAICKSFDKKRCNINGLWGMVAYRVLG
jgi:hypothetical protein